MHKAKPNILFCQPIQNENSSSFANQGETGGCSSPKEEVLSVP
jgi:hypothetical protein